MQVQFGTGVAANSTSTGVHLVHVVAKAVVLLHGVVIPVFENVKK